MRTRHGFWFATALTIILLGCRVCPGAVSYSGNGDMSGGGAIGLGNIVMSDNGTTISATFTRGTPEGDPEQGEFAFNLVFFIDSVAGGLHDTKLITDNTTGLKRAVSGVNFSTGDKSSLVFAPGFYADYALVLTAQSSSSTLFRLESDGNLVTLRNVNFIPSDQNRTSMAATYRLNFDWSDIGLAPGPGNSFRWESTYVSNGGYRYLEGFESLTGSVGYGTNTFTSIHGYPTADPVPEMANWALAIFGGIVVGTGAMQRCLKRRQVTN